MASNSNSVDVIDAAAASVPAEEEEEMNFRMGAPDKPSLAAMSDLLTTASAHAAEQARAAPKTTIFDYGPAAGPEDCRRRLADFLSHNYASPVSSDQLILTSGATVGLRLLASLLLQRRPRPGVVFVEYPTYFMGRQLLEEDLGLRCVPVPVEDDGSGVDVNYLERAVKEERAKLAAESNSDVAEAGRFWAMFYSIPVFHNPTGAVLSPDKCRRVVSLARQHDFLVVCDDVYNLLNYDDDEEGLPSPPPQRLFAYDDPSDPGYAGGHVVSNSSFSKILAPGFRVGWLELPPRMFDTLNSSASLNSGGALQHVMGGVVGSLLELGLLQTHLERLRQILGRRMRAVLRSLEQELPEGFQFTRPSGGYFIWVSGPENFDSDELFKWLLQEHKIRMLPSSAAGQMAGRPSRRAFRLSVAFNEVDRLERQVPRLCRLIRHFVSNPSECRVKADMKSLLLVD